MQGNSILGAPHIQPRLQQRWQQQRQIQSRSPHLPMPLCLIPPNGATCKFQAHLPEHPLSTGHLFSECFPRSLAMYSSSSKRHPTSLVMAASLTPTMPYCSRSATVQARTRS